jgi:hypothetical protein
MKYFKALLLDITQLLKVIKLHLFFTEKKEYEPEKRRGLTE